MTSADIVARLTTLGDKELIYRCRAGGEVAVALRVAGDTGPRRIEIREAAGPLRARVALAPDELTDLAAIFAAVAAPASP